MERPYRKNVAAIIVNPQGMILLCERFDIAGAWQLPQGGIESGEDRKTALFRELEEEIGTNEVEIIDQIEEPLRYDWPKYLHNRGYRGQEQYYFLALLQDEKNICFKPVNGEQEFKNFIWVSLEDFKTKVESFKREVYLKALGIFDRQNPNLFLAKA